MFQKLCFFSTTVVCFLLFIAQTTVSSCTKTVTVIDSIIHTQTDTLISIIRDTLQEKDTALTAAILTATPWKLQEVRALSGGTYIYYTRGGTANSQSFDNEYITFHADNSGTYQDNAGSTTTFTWQFTNTSNTQLVWIWNLPQPVTITWENIAYDDGALRYTEYYTQFGTNVLASEVRIPK